MDKYARVWKVLLVSGPRTEESAFSKGVTITARSEPNVGEGVGDLARMKFGKKSNIGWPLDNTADANRHSGIATMMNNNCRDAERVSKFNRRRHEE